MKGLHNLVEKCYATENILSLAAEEAFGRELRYFLDRSALLFKDLGDQLFLAIVGQGGKPYFDLNSGVGKERPWLERTSFRSAKENFDYYRIAVNAQKTAASELRSALDGRQKNDELHLVLSKGIAELSRNIDEGVST